MQIILGYRKKGSVSAETNRGPRMKGALKDAEAGV